MAVCLSVAAAIWGAMPGVGLPIWFVLATYGVLYVATLATFFVCGVIWIGFDEPLGVEALRLAAVCAITEVARAIVSPLPMNFRIQTVVQMVVGFVFIASLMQLMEMEKEDAIIFAIFAWVVRITLTYVLLYQAMRNGWI